MIQEEKKRLDCKDVSKRKVGEVKGRFPVVNPKWRLRVNCCEHYVSATSYLDDIN